VGEDGVGEHYFTTDPAVASHPRRVALRLPDVSLDLESDAGVFSADRLDRGTRVLLENAPMPPVRGPLLDLGCGYGPIALTLATRRRRLPVWAVDVNSRALGLTERNAAAAGLGNVTVARPEEVPADLRFAGIYSNPPIRSGKAALHTLLGTWLPRLQPAGRAYLVVGKNLGADSLARWLVEQGWPATRLTSVGGFRVLEISPGTAPEGG
jgi:16S rRNA (guanine1207-N2)-methyltransferase